MSEHGTDQQRALSADQQRMAELQRLLGKYGQMEIQDLMARLEQAEVRAEQAATDAARIVAFAQRIETLEMALRQNIIEIRADGTHYTGCRCTSCSVLSRSLEALGESQ